MYQSFIDILKSETEKFNPYHDALGRFTDASGALATSIAEETLSNGGASVRAKTGIHPHTGYMVATHSDRGEIIDMPKSGGKQYVADKIESFIDKNSDLLSKTGHYVGTWVDGGKLYLDVSQRKMDRDTAISLGKKHDQIAIFDLSTFEEIDTGGSGAVGKSFKEIIEMEKVKKIDPMFFDVNETSPEEMAQMIIDKYGFDEDREQKEENE